MLWKLIKTELKPLQLSGAFLGGLTGMVIMLCAAMFYLDVSPIFNDRESFWNDEYIIVSKKITLNNTYNQAGNSNAEKPVFKKDEITTLTNKPFIKEVAPFSHCTFNVSAYTDNNSMLAGFYTDLFFEAVPSKFIDVNYDNWTWNNEMTFIPAILPKTYLNLYNFGFATTQNLPQVSEKSASLISFNIKVKGNGKSAQFTARIIGFSDRINTILVPEEFVKWGNENFGQNTAPDPSRLIVVANDPSNPELFSFFDQQNYDVNKSELSNSKALMFLRIIITVILTIGLIITLLAFWLMLTAVLLLLQRNKEYIIKLKIIGYSIREIAIPYYTITSIFFSLVSILAFIPILFLRNYYQAKLQLLGYNIISTGLAPIILIAFGIFAIMLIISILNIRRKLFQFK
jgi:hypothetical protein